MVLQILDIERRGLAVGLKLLRSQVRHLGTEVNLKLLQSIYEELLANGVKMKFNTEIKDVLVNKDSSIDGVIDSKNEEYHGKYVVLNVGRPGSQWLSKCLRKHRVKLKTSY